MDIIGQFVPQCMELFCSGMHVIAANKVPVAMTMRSIKAANLNADFMSTCLDYFRKMSQDVT
jgi:homoserine dehydrogenase